MGSSRDIPAGRLTSAALALALVSACSSETVTDVPRACTLIGCDDGLKVDLVAAEGGWRGGDYVFTFRIDDTPVRCAASLPLPACSAGRAVSCEPAGMVTIVESGCALPASAQGFPQVAFDPRLRPDRVSVTIEWRGETVIAREELAPRFRTSEPNGPGCPPVCTQAQGSVSVRF
jgi:hypothetical protein